MTPPDWVRMKTRERPRPAIEPATRAQIGVRPTFTIPMGPFSPVLARTMRMAGWFAGRERQHRVRPRRHDRRRLIGWTRPFRTTDDVAHPRAGALHGDLAHGFDEVDEAPGGEGAARGIGRRVGVDEQKVGRPGRAFDDALDDAGHHARRLVTRAHLGVLGGLTGDPGVDARQGRERQHRCDEKKADPPAERNAGLTQHARPRSRGPPGPPGLEGRSCHVPDRKRRVSPTTAWVASSGRRPRRRRWT